MECRIGLPTADDAVDAVLVFGGDGTIHRHLPQLVALALPVMIVPAGSGNDFARALGLKRVRDSLAAWKKFCADRSNVHAIDLGTVVELGARSSGREALRLATHYFCCAASIGLDSDVARRANELPRWLRGHGGYVLSLMPALARFAAFRMKIHTNDAAAKWTLSSDRPTMLAAFANAPLYGGGMKIAPRAKIDDGLLDVCTIEGIDAFRLFCLFPTIYSGRHLQIKEVHYLQAAAARVETEHPMDVYADGEFVCRTPVEIGVGREALKVIAPKS